MKQKVLRAFLAFALAGSIAFSGLGSSWTGMETVEAAKIVQSTTLGQVTGLAYNAEKKQLTWNKVAGATKYNVVITRPDGTKYHDTAYGKKYTFDSYYQSWTDGTYTVTVQAVDGSSYYETTKDDDYDWSRYDRDTDTQIYYKNPVGPVASITLQLTNEKAVTNSITKLPGIACKEAKESSVVFQVSGKPVLNKGETIEWEYSNNPNFLRQEAKHYFRYSSSTYDVNSTFDVYYGSFSPGDTIYVRARVYNPYYEKPNSQYTYSADCFGDYTPVVTYTVPMTEVSALTRVDGTSITVEAELENGSATGYQFAKKVKSKWVNLSTQTSPTYADKNLKKNEKYQYRVRAYHYNKNTQKVTWSDWCNVEAVTWGSNLKLKATAAGATSVKLTWTPVSGAEGYEIYRYDTRSYTKTREKGYDNEYYSSMKLIKTLKKSSKKYTDKKLTKGKNYTYVVRAYKTIDKKKVYVEATATAKLKAGSLSFSSEYVNAAGKTVVNWSKINGVQGYYVEKYNEDTSQYERINTIGAKATSYTFDKVDVGGASVRYRIRPYDAKAVYSGDTVSVTPTLAAVQGVKAVKSGNGIMVSWNPVAGADYYHVYRTTDSTTIYDKTTKTYRGYGLTSVEEAVVNTKGCHPELGGSAYTYAGTYSTYDITGTSVLDATLTYQQTAEDSKGEPIPVGKDAEGRTLYQTEEELYYQGPEPGVTYYYYVVACAETTNGANGETSTKSVGYGKPASAIYTNVLAKKVSKITSASSKKKGQVTLKFKKVSNVDGYAVYRATKKNGTYSIVGTTTKPTFTDKSAESGKTYYYKVASYVKGEAKANIYSAKTSAKKVKVK